jgi:multiple sugar transport system substrate-binding protein
MERRQNDVRKATASTRRRWGAQLAAGGAATWLAGCDWFGAPQPSSSSKGCGQPLELTIPWPETNPVNAGLRKAADEFGATRGRCTVHLTVVSPWNEETLTAGVAGGSAPPLTLLAPTTVTTWGPQGLLEPLDDVFQRDKLSGNDFVPPVWETMSYQGQVWHLPLQVDPNFPFFWNKATLRQAGLNPDRAPATVDELDQAAQALNREAGGRWERVGFVPWSWYGTGNSVVTAAYSFGGSFYDRDRDRATFNHPQVVKAVEWMAGWAQRLDVDRITQLLSGTNVVRLLAAGKVAFHPMVSVDLPAARRENAGVELGSGPLPGSPPGQAGAVWTGGWHAAAVSGSKRKEEAWELLRWLGASNEGTLSVARNMGGLPGYVKSPGLDLLAKDADTAAHVDALRRARFPHPGFYLPVAVDYAPVADALSGKRSAQAVLDEMTEQTQLKLEQHRAQPGRRP